MFMSIIFFVRVRVQLWGWHPGKTVLSSTGDAEIVVAGGQESMSDSPHVLNRSREGQCPRDPRDPRDPREHGAD